MNDRTIHYLATVTLAAIVIGELPARADDTEESVETDGTVVKRTTYKGGEPQAEIRKKNGVKHGVQVFWSTSGMRSETTFEHGVEHGPVRELWANGNKKVEGSYEHGLRSGTWTDYDSSGQVLFTKTYLYGKVIGTKQQFGDGIGPQKGRRIVVRESNHLLGLEHGRVTEYWSNGHVSASGEYVLGRREGSWEFHGTDGQLTKTVSYSCGRKIERTIETAGSDWGPCRPATITLSRPKAGRGTGKSVAKNKEDVTARLQFDRRICALLEAVTGIEVRIEGKPLTCPHFNIRTKTPTRGSVRG